MDKQEWIPLIHSSHFEHAFDKILVLEALGINWKWEQNIIWVEKAKAKFALKEILEYEHELLTISTNNSNLTSNYNASYFIQNSIMFALLSLIFVLQQYFPHLTSQLILNALKIKNKEYFRLFTSLFIHADPAHLLGNIFFSFYFIQKVCEQIGFKITWILILGLGTIANGINLLFLGLPHKSLGFSTASFVALGLFFTLTPTRSNLSVWLKIALALCFLAIFSQGKHTDVGSHFWGLILGFCTGFYYKKAINEK
ncbi:rhomboid family intramembrane serine protease [Desulfonauticus submarinus]